MTRDKLIEELKKASVSIYVAADEIVATDISNLMLEAIKQLTE